MITSSKTRSAPAAVQRRAQAFEEAVGRRHQAHVGGDRLHDHRREIGAVAVEGLVERGVVVVGHDDGVGDGALGDARGAGQAERGDAAAGGDEQRVDVAVVAAGELQDLRATGRAAGEADRRSSPPRCPTTPGAPSRPTAPARRWPRPARPRVRSARRTTCRRPRRAAPPRRPPGARARGSTRPTTARSRGSGGRRCRTGTRPPARSTKNGSPPTDANERTGESTPPGIAASARS